MRFQNIKMNADGVELDRLDKLADGSELTQKMKNAARPLGTMRAALQAFVGYAVELVGVPDWNEDANVTSVHLSEEPKTSRRGLIVTFTRRIERAKNRVVVINTPLMHAPAADQEGTNPGTFPAEVANMIAEVEREATRYWNGEREQGEMFDRPATAGGKPAEDQVGARRARKGATQIPGVGDVTNADKIKEPTDDRLREMLLAAGRDVPVDAIARWTSGERDAAQRWAENAVDKSFKGERPAEPEVLKRDATPALLEDVAKATPTKKR